MIGRLYGLTENVIDNKTEATVFVEPVLEGVIHADF
jgi:hypothetical protein